MKPPNVWEMIVLLWLIAMVSLAAWSAYNIGKLDGKAERCEYKPRPQKSAYSMTKLQLKRMIRYELAKGEVK